MNSRGFDRGLGQEAIQSFVNQGAVRFQVRFKIHRVDNGQTRPCIEVKNAGKFESQKGLKGLKGPKGRKDGSLGSLGSFASLRSLGSFAAIQDLLLLGLGIWFGFFSFILVFANYA